jgi:hypothetical protein
VDLELSANLKTALSAWVAEAVQHIKDRSELAKLKKCMDGDGDVRIVFSARRMPSSSKRSILPSRRPLKFFAKSWCPG